MSRPLQWAFGLLIAALIVGGPLAYLRYEKANLRNLRVVRDGVLYRSGQLSARGLKHVIEQYGIRTVVSLRDADAPGKPPPDLREEEYCRLQEINFYRLPPRAWELSNGIAPVEPNVRQFRAILDDPKNHPVLLHCFAGAHRTGAYCAVYRLEYEGWPLAAALDEMRACGYEKLDEEWDILDYLESYRPRWLRQIEESGFPHQELKSLQPFSH
jgi:protein tyrosine/serine phosphatase